MILTHQAAVSAAGYRSVAAGAAWSNAGEDRAPHEIYSFCVG